MNSFLHKPHAQKVTFDHENICIELVDGRKLFVPLAYFPRLLNADPQQRNDYILSAGGAGIHWDSLDEDIRVDNLLLGIFDNPNKHYKSA